MFVTSIPFFFFFNDTATTEIYTLSLHDALPISPPATHNTSERTTTAAKIISLRERSEEHTSELQSRLHLVCRLLLEKKKNPAWYAICSPSANSIIKTMQSILFSLRTLIPPPAS